MAQFVTEAAFGAAFSLISSGFGTSLLVNFHKHASAGIDPSTIPTAGVGMSSPSVSAGSEGDI